MNEKFISCLFFMLTSVALFGAGSGDASLTRGAIFDLRKQIYPNDCINQALAGQNYIIDSRNLLRPGKLYYISSQTALKDALKEIFDTEHIHRNIHHQIIVISKRELRVIELPQDLDTVDTITAPGDVVVINDYS